jgi:hypothetical protein
MPYRELLSAISHSLPSYPKDQHLRIEIYEKPTAVECWRGLERIYSENLTNEEYLFTVKYIKFLATTVDLSELTLDKSLSEKPSNQ